MKKMFLIFAGAVVAWATCEIILQQADLAFEGRAIRAGYYCQAREIVRPSHVAKCEKVAHGVPYRQAFSEYFAEAK